MNEETKLVVRRIIGAPINRVWEALTRADELKDWYAPEEMTTPEAVSELRVGGNFLVTMQNDSDKKQFTARGNYKEIEPNKKLVLSWKWDQPDSRETTVMWEFHKISDNETEVVLTHSGFADTKDRDEHKQGWESACNKLEKHFAKGILLI